MAVRIREILACIKAARNEAIICAALIGLTILTLCWPGDAPAVFLSQSSDYNNISNDNFYLCSIDFSNTKWVEKYSRFSCFIEIDGKEYHIMDEYISQSEKNVAFGLPKKISNTLDPGNHKCRLIIRPSYKYGDELDSELIETSSNHITISYY